MDFVTAVRTVLSKYAVFGGRARRSEYWYFFLFNALLAVVLAIVDLAIGSPVLGWIVTLALLLPGIAVGVRRLHDTNRSGYYYFLILIPLVGAIILIVFYCQDSVGENQYGPSPKQLAGGGYPPPTHF